MVVPRRFPLGVLAGRGMYLRAAGAADGPPGQQVVELLIPTRHLRVSWPLPLRSFPGLACHNGGHFNCDQIGIRIRSTPVAFSVKPGSEQAARVKRLTTITACRAPCCLSQQARWGLPLATLRDLDRTLGVAYSGDSILTRQRHSDITRTLQGARFKSIKRRSWRLWAICFLNAYSR